MAKLVHMELKVIVLSGQLRSWGCDSELLFRIVYVSLFRVVAFLGEVSANESHDALVLPLVGFINHSEI